MKEINNLNDEALEQRIRTSLEKATPDVLPAVLGECKEMKGTNKMENITPVTPRSHKKLARILAAAAAFVLVAAGILGLCLKLGSGSSDYMLVLLDVNPGIEIRVNDEERVVSVRALNADAVKVLEGMDFSGSTIEVAVNAIVGSMLKNGYLTEIANSILISVEGSDKAASELLQQKLTSEIDAVLSAAAINGAVLSMTIAPGNAELEGLAEEYGITAGKAQLILALIESNPNYTFPELASLSINQLNLLAEGKELSGINKNGTPDSSGYISADSAKAIALEHAGVAESEILLMECSLEFEDGQMVYDVEFRTAAMEYEYEIDPIDGSILGFEAKPLDYSPDPGEQYIGEDRAMEIALSTAGLTEAEYIDCKLEHDDGIPVYEIEFGTSEYRYECEIHAVTGAVVKWERHSLDVPTAAPGGYLTRQQVKNIVFNHAGVLEADVRGLEIELDREDCVYEVEFKCGNYEYDYEVHAVTGSIIKSEREPIGGSTPAPGTTPRPTATPSGRLTEQQVKEIVFNHAGVLEADVRGLEIELDRDDNVYEVEFKCGNYEYEYEVHAVTGSIIKSEREWIGGSVPTPAATVRPTATPGARLTEQQVKEIVFNHAGVLEADVRELEIELDREDNVYEVEFKCGNYEYEYEVHAVTGSIIKSEREWIGGSAPTPAATVRPTAAPQPTATPGARLTEQQVKEIVFNHAGVLEADVRELEIELDREDNVYEVEFKCGNYEYEYEVHAVTGSIIKSEREWIGGSASTPQPSEAPGDRLTEQQVKEIVFSHAGVLEADVRELEIELDREDNVYEVEFKCGNYEYEYKVHAVTGSIIQSEREWAGGADAESTGENDGFNARSANPAKLGFRL